MPTFEKMSKDEVTDYLESKHRGRGKSKREKALEQYIEQIRPLEVNEGITVRAAEGENRQTVKNRLRRAAGRLGYEIGFIRSRNVIRLHRTA
ncbi:MAG: hypothetical protein HUU23_03220 [Caldilineales bacterium]|nr:hypothetical protein [Caldilineales bacterium]